MLSKPARSRIKIIFNGSYLLNFIKGIEMADILNIHNLKQEAQKQLQLFSEKAAFDLGQLKALFYGDLHAIYMTNVSDEAAPPAVKIMIRLTPQQLELVEEKDHHKQRQRFYFDSQKLTINDHDAPEKSYKLFFEKMGKLSKMIENEKLKVFQEMKAK